MSETVESATKSLPEEIRRSYRLVRLLGSGAMGHVYEAEQISLRRRVALKLMRPEAFSDLETAKRLEEEARILSRLSHPNIVHLFDAGVVSGVPYVVTEYVDGETWAARIGGRSLPVETAVELTLQLLDGLEYLHSRGIIHRDLKPDNVFITGAGEVKVIDFGLARALVRETALTREGFAVGTPMFMAPEQILGKEPSTGWDLYAVGVMLYRTLGGKYPFPHGNTSETIERKLTADPDPLDALAPHAPAALRAAVESCMTRDDARRVRTCAELRKRIARFAPPRSSPAVERAAVPARPRPAVPASRMRSRASWLAALLGIAAVGYALSPARLPTEAALPEPVAAKAETGPAPLPAPETCARLISEFREDLRTIKLEELREEMFDFPGRFEKPGARVAAFESILAPIDYRSRLAKLEPLAQSAEVAALPPKTMQGLYYSAREFRRADVFCETLGIPFRTGIEKLSRPEHRLSTSSRLPAPAERIEVPLTEGRDFQAQAMQAWDPLGPEPVNQRKYHFEAAATQLGARAEMALRSKDLPEGSAFEILVNPGENQSFVYFRRRPGDPAELYHGFDARSLQAGRNRVVVRFSAPVKKLEMMRASLASLAIRVSVR